LRAFFDKFVYAFQENNTTRPIVFPNPFTNKFQIQLSSQKAEAYQFKIYNIQGKVMLESAGNLIKGDNSIIINQLGDLPSGVYYYQLNTDHNRFSNMIVKE